MLVRLLGCAGPSAQAACAAGDQALLSSLMLLAVKAASLICTARQGISAGYSPYTRGHMKQ